MAGATRGAGYDSHGQDGSPIPSPPVSLYAPRETDTEGDLTRVRGQMRPTGEMLTTTETGAPETASDSHVPYYEVVGEYSRAAEEALSREEVPPSYRKTVRAYFQALQSGSENDQPQADAQ